MVIKYTESGKPEIIIGTHTDITERKKAEEEYKRISVVASANENGVLFTDAEGKISWSNEGFLKLTGYTKEEVAGKTPLEICEGPLSKSNALQDMVNAFFEGRSFNVEIIHYRKDKTWFWGRVTGQAIMDDEKKVKQYFAIVENITYKKEAEQAIKINEEKYRNIIANMNLGLLEVDNEENIQFANHSFCGMSGYTLQELIGKKASTLFVREESSELMETKNDMRKKGVSDAYEIYIKNKSGEDKWWLISGAARYNDKRELVGSIGIHLDITQQKQLEIELIEAREQAELSANAKQTFLANMSHEVRTPMNAILGMGRQLQKTALNEQQQLYLQTINDAGENLLVVINDILDISKIEAGKLTLENIGFNINDVIKRAIQVMQYRAEEKGLKIISSADENIGPILQGDPYRLNQILLNLLSNTVKFSDKGIIQISCRLISNESNHQLIEIKVTDNGIGMEKKFLDNLFQSFTQEDRSVSRKYGGTGLGMAITKQLVELMGGSIDVQSKKDIGTTVTLTIPFIKGTINMLPDQDIKNLDKDILKDKEILLVEDNEMNRLVATTTLNYYGAVITEAINGAEAVELLKKFEYDLVLMDMQMPVMDGLEATRVIRNELQSTVPIIALTANAIKGENEKCITAGMNDYISKPFDEQNLVNMIAKWLGEKDNIIVKEENKGTNLLYDLSNLKAISRGDDNFIKKMIMLFMEQVPSSLVEIHAAVEQNDFIKISAVAHKIKPSIDNMGIGSLKNVIRQIESLAQKNQHSQELNLKIEKLDYVLKETIKALENEFLN
jgi:PAS domain S-box-containing protein